MFLQLGNIVFDKARSPNSISEKLDATYAQHELINQPARLQPTGRELEEHTFSLYLHRDFSRVQAEVDQLKKSLKEYEVLPMLWGNGTVAGNFVITSLSVGKPYMSGEGDLYAADVEITLKEFPVNAVSDRQAKADKKAYATGTNKAVTGRKAGSPTLQTATRPCNQHLSEAASKLKAQAHQVQLQFDYFINNSGNLTASNVIGPSISRPALQARNTAVGLAREHNECIRLNYANEVLQVQRKAQDLADAAARPPTVSSAWWGIVANKHGAFQAAVNAFVSATQREATRAVSRSGD